MLLASVLLLVALGFVLAEVFFPSMGLLGLIAAVLVLFADLVAFDVGQGWGWTFVALEVVLVPLVVWLGFRALPHVPFGRRMLLEGPSSPPGAGTPDHAHFADREGVALTTLRPSGRARFDDIHVTVVAVGGMIERDTPIVVVDVEGAEIRVRPRDDAPSSP